MAAALPRMYYKKDSDKTQERIGDVSSIDSADDFINEDYKADEGTEPTGSTKLAKLRKKGAPARK